jgi:hypothetical protein
LGDPSDVVPIVLITPEVAERYEELTDIAPDKNMVKELNQFNGKGDSEEENDTIGFKFPLAQRYNFLLSAVIIENSLLPVFDLPL